MVGNLRASRPRNLHEAHTSVGGGWLALEAQHIFNSTWGTARNHGLGFHHKGIAWYEFPVSWVWCKLSINFSSSLGLETGLKYNSHDFQVRKIWLPWALWHYDVEKAFNNQSRPNGTLSGAYHEDIKPSCSIPTIWPQSKMRNNSWS